MLNNNMWAAIIDYSKNQETICHAPAKDRGQAKLLTAGVDIGLTSSKVVVMADGQLFAYGIFWGDTGSPDKAGGLLDAVLNGTGVSRDGIQSLVATGRGANDVFQGDKRTSPEPYRRTVSEIACHARGAFYCYNNGDNNSIEPLRTVLAMGGLDCAAIHCDEKGLVKTFLTNACSPSHCRRSLCGGCGAAQGRAMDVIADVLAVPLEEVSNASLKISPEQLEGKLAQPPDERQDTEDEGSPMPLSATLNDICVVLAKSQVMGLLRNHWSPEEVLAACCAGLAHNAALLLQRIGIRKEVSLTGGVAKNYGVVRRLEQELGITAVLPKPDPQITGALGAALFAGDLLLKSQKADG